MLKQRLLSVFLYAITAMTLSSTSIAASLDQQVEAIYDDQLSDLFVWFHQNPELSNREFNTSARIVEILRGMGLEPRTGLRTPGGGRARAARARRSLVRRGDRHRAASR